MGPEEVPTPEAPAPEEGENPDEPILKSVQKLTGKLTQKMRDGGQELESKDYKYVVNSILSAIDMTKVSEEDMEDAFGYDETKFMDADETIDFFMDELGFDEDDAKGRSEEMGKDPKLDDSSEFKGKKNFVMKGRLTEKGKVLSKEDLIKMADDMLVSKSEDKDLKIDRKLSPILVRNIKALKKLALLDGISTSELVKILKNE